MISWFEKHSSISWLITIIIAILIFYISSLSFTSGSGGTSYNAIIYHILAFFSLTFFILISTIKGKNLNYLLLAISISFLYAISDEIHQLFVPGRSGNLQDLFFDSIGILFAFIFYLSSLKLRKGSNNLLNRRTITHP
jgi:VanZ family protein